MMIVMNIVDIRIDSALAILMALSNNRVSKSFVTETIIL